MLGWIKLHRLICDNELYFSERFTRMQAWVDLLLLATHKPQTVFIRGVEINLKPGELCYSQLSLAKRWKWNRKTVMAFLKSLEKREMLLNRTDNRLSHFTTVITIRNWCEYQADGQQDGQRNGQRKDNGTDTNKNEENVNNENTFQEGGYIFENELLKITAKQLEEMKTSYPSIKKFHPEFTLCSDLMREKQRKGQVIGSPLAFLHSHLRRAQDKQHANKQPTEQAWGSGKRSGECLNLADILKGGSHA